MLMQFLTFEFVGISSAYCTYHTGVWTPPPPTSIHSSIHPSVPCKHVKDGRYFPPLTACATATPILKTRDMRPSRFIFELGHRCCLSVLPLTSSQPCPANRIQYTKGYHGCAVRLRLRENASILQWQFYFVMRERGKCPALNLKQSSNSMTTGDKSSYLALGHAAMRPSISKICQ